MAVVFDINTALFDGYDFASVCQTLDKELAEAIKADDGASNEIWRQRQLFGIWGGYREVFDLLKNSKFYQAWCLIENIEIDNLYLLRNFPEDATLTEFAIKHLQKLQWLFPYQLFLSTVIEVKKEVCSICGTPISPWTQCGHIPGRLYNGQLCLKEVSEMAMVSADIVEHPEHKYAVFPHPDSENLHPGYYDYSWLKSLIGIWLIPFQNWDIIKEERYHTPPEGIKDTDPCPCRYTFRTYADCCKQRPGIRKYNFTIFQHLPYGEEAPRK